MLRKRREVRRPLSSLHNVKVFWIVLSTGSDALNKPKEFDIGLGQPLE